MKRSVLTVMLLVFAFGLVGAAKPASAQLNFQLGYQFLRVTNEPGTNYPLGFDVNLSIPLPNFGAGSVRAVGDVNWGRHSESESGIDASSTLLAAGAGLRYVPPMLPRLGIQALVGISKAGFKVETFDIDESETDLFIQPGVHFHALSINDSWDMVVGGNFRLILSAPESGKAITFVVGLSNK